ncbi:trypsin-like peptidase domain-containing protein [Streptomyces sp. SHP 1-2]|uniref:trypsin-like peptidase domain-containing protein n=1 Tax=Streptomyces sp. SHP 1-2 TaxID=2769489 RepID=UPI002237F837|nr:trypsin-like peptidase domain-containing protein [Streptomyces sp. SHP 1-2]MCW5253244.1 trypsin-like peptidase domain-containing protein [Streptomyces sp. SHP 1-2]
MNEGKPTRAKWWSRPPAADGDGPGSARAADGGDGDFELERPRPARGPGDSPPGPDGGGVPPGPAAPRAGGAPADGDFVLHRPDPRPPSGPGPEPDGGPDGAPRPGTPGPAAHARDAGTAPGSAGGAPAGDALAPDPGGISRAASIPSPEGARAPGGTAVPGLAGRAHDEAHHLDGPPAPARPGTAAPAPVEARVRPLHDPDPYGTPPYGEPGPWAPAPPVQHPGATPAHGTAVPPPRTGASAAPPREPGHEPPTAPAPAVPAHGTAAPHPPHPGPHGAPHSPAAHGATPYETAPYETAPRGTAPRDAPVPGARAPHAPRPGAPADAAAPSAALAASGSGADPWGRYDPWAPVPVGPLQHGGPAEPPRRPVRRRTALLGGALLIALVSGGIGGGIGTYLERNGGLGTVELPQAGPEPTGRAPDSVAGIAARALPGVVTLHVSGGGSAGTGTGFVLDGRGHILTNNHVVGRDGRIIVTFHSGDTAEATVVGRDSGYDLAVVKVRGVRGLTPMPLGNSDNVRVGDPVVAIGAPFDLAGTVTSGIISAKERPITAGGEEGDGSDVSYVDALQTDAPINPGNSGGPLLDTRGRVIGINSAIRSAGGGSGGGSGSGQAGSIGLGFAIPINQGKRVAEELINTGRATHPVIGLTLDMGYDGGGARVADRGSGGGPPVTGGGPGARAGIRAGDVITAADGRRVRSGEELIVRIRSHRPGDRLELTLERDGRETKVSLVLGSSGGD